jgi:LytS/YehU family sensor histidine kinase
VALLAIVVELCVTPVAAVAGIATYQEQISLYWLYVIASFVLFGLWTLCYLAVVRYRENEMRSLRLEASLRGAELRALKSQVNPHFLFNCLNNVRSLVAEDAEKAREKLLRLSELLRYALEAGMKEKVSLAGELHIVEAYLELEKLQFDERLSWRVVADAEVRRAMVPPMFVQQLVENAVKHGISREPAGGEILIMATLRAGSLEVKVENTGHLVEPLGVGFGLANARERLRLLCGTNSELRLENAAGGRVAAIAEIPGAA